MWVSQRVEPEIGPEIQPEIAPAVASAPNAPNALKRRWEVEAEEMRKRNLLKRGLLVTPAEKDHCVRKAYRLLLLLHSDTYWTEERVGEGGSPKGSPKYRPGVRARRRKIREYCLSRSHELFRQCVTRREHQEVIKGLQEKTGTGRRRKRVEVAWERMTPQEQNAEIWRLKKKVARASS